ncbi:hypothetical protein HDV00_000847 [Rhizophlyctis rosea]|nr:hypothetical protein HDV00_000847 [Rhizophlyctis rosea]
MPPKNRFPQQALPTKNPPAKAKPLSREQQDKEISDRIAEARAAIEAEERVFKENVSIKRAQMHPAAVFSNDLTLVSYQDAEGVMQELMSRAKEMLATTAKQKSKAEELKENEKTSVAQELAKKIASARARYRQKEEFIKSGPQFISHLICSFGDIISVQIISDQSFLVFSSPNTLEIWEVDPTPPSTTTSTPQLKHLIHLPTDPITTLSFIDKEDITPFTGTQTPQTNQSHTTSRRGSVGSALRDSVPGRESVNVRGGRLSVPYAPDVPKPEESGRRRGAAGGRRFSVVPEERALSSSFLMLGNETPKPSVMRYTFFVGCVTGWAHILQVDVTSDPNEKSFSYTHSLPTTRRISLSPIRLSHYIEFDLVITAVVSHSGFDHVLCAYNTLLEDEWQCKADLLRITAKDKQMKVVAQLRLETVREQGGAGGGGGGGGVGGGRPFTADESPISALTADDYHKNILVAMRSGSILRLNCETVMASGTKDVPKVLEELKDEKEKKDEKKGGGGKDAARARRESIAAQVDAPPALRKDLFVAWVLDVHSINSDQPGLVRPTKPTNTTTGEEKQTYISRAPTGVRITTLHTLIHTPTHKPHLILTCHDGTTRGYPLDTGAATATPLLYQSEDDRKMELNQFQRNVLGVDLGGVGGSVWGELVKVDGDVEWVVCYSCEGILSIFEILSPSPMLELRILSNRYTHPATLNPTQHPSTPSDARQGLTMASAAQPEEEVPRQVRMLDQDKGIAVIISGREWSLVDLRSLVDVARRKNEEGSGKG